VTSPEVTCLDPIGRDGLKEDVTRCMEKGQDRTKVLPSNVLFLTCRASASNAVVTGRMLDEESKCGVFKKSRRCRRTTR
jgi:hypothetical protein